MSNLIDTPNLAEHDGFYTDLLRAHDGLDLEQSHAMNAQLVLILANHIGDRDVLNQALALARKQSDR